MSGLIDDLNAGKAVYPVGQRTWVGYAIMLAVVTGFCAVLAWACLSAERSDCRIQAILPVTIWVIAAGGLVRGWVKLRAYARARVQVAADGLRYWDAGGMEYFVPWSAVTELRMEAMWRAPLALRLVYWRDGEEGALVMPLERWRRDAMQGVITRTREQAGLGQETKRFQIRSPWFSVTYRRPEGQTG